jgi:hypothetical protein
MLEQDVTDEVCEIVAAAATAALEGMPGLAPIGKPVSSYDDARRCLARARACLDAGKADAFLPLMREAAATAVAGVDRLMVHVLGDMAACNQWMKTQTIFKRDEPVLALTKVSHSGSVLLLYLGIA